MAKSNRFVFVLLLFLVSAFCALSPRQAQALVAAPNQSEGAPEGEAALSAKTRGKARPPAFPAQEYVKYLNNSHDKARDRGLRRMLGRHPNHPQVVPLLIDAVAKALQDNTASDATYRMIQVLGRYDQPETIAQLLGWLEQSKDAAGLAEFTFQIVETLSRFDRPEVHAALIDLLDAKDIRIAILATDALAALHPDAALEPIMNLVNRPKYEEHYGFRFSVLAAVSAFDTRQAVGFLVANLPTLRGHLKFLVVKHLSRVTRQPFGGDARRWTQWWNSQRESLPPIDEGEPAPSDVAWDYPVPTFYGHKVYSTRVVFVIDISSTMRQQVRGGMMRLDQAKVELSKAIAGLPGDAMFNIIAFDRNVRPWQRSSVQALPPNKGQAVRAIKSLTIGSGTAIFDGIEAAFQADSDAEVIYLLTDGLPSAGRVKDPNEIVRVVTKANRFRKIAINTISVGRSSDLLLQLSRHNFGDYRRSG